MLHRSRSGVLGSFLIAMLGIAGCSTDVPSGVGVAQGCVLNSDCNATLSCIFGKCHSPCAVTGDCRGGERCLKLPTGSVCQLSTERTECTYASECPAPLKCAVDSRCRVACRADTDCGLRQSCVSFVCADSDEVNPVTNDVAHTNPSGGWAGAELDASVTDAAVSEPEGGQADAIEEGVDASSHDDERVVDAGRDSGVAKPEASSPRESGSAPCVDGGSVHPSNLPSGMTTLPPDAGGVYSPALACEFDTDTLKHNYVGCPNVGATGVIPLDPSREAAVLFVDSFVIRTGITLSITGKRPLIVVATGPIEINGTLDARASATNGWYAGGAPGPGSVTRAGICPIDSVAGGGREGASSSTPIGAGGGGFCGVGGTGSPEVVGGTPPAGGLTYGNAELEPLVGGSSGGSASTFNILNHGGGAVQLTSGTSISIGDTGIINMGGGTASSGPAAPGVGGGSGGAILLEAPTVTIKGVIAANGAGGSADWSGQQNGQASKYPALGGALDNPATARAGSGAAGDVIQGGNPQQLATDRRAGGGGGAGRIRINTCDGTVAKLGSSVISPSEATPCFTTGPLH